VGYDPATRAHALTGAGPGALRDRGEATLEAPLGETPVLVRPGAVLCLLDPAVDTLAPYGERCTRADALDRRVLLAFPSAPWSGWLAPGVHARGTPGPASWVLELARARSTPGAGDAGDAGDAGGSRFDLQADLGLLAGGAPRAVEVRGAASHAYDPATGVLHAALAPATWGAPVRLEVRIRPL
jgi:hypothetical protein